MFKSLFIVKAVAWKGKCVILWTYCSLSATQSFKVCITGDYTDKSGLWCDNNDFVLKCLGSFLTCSGTLAVPDVHEALCVDLRKDCKHPSYAQENTTKAESSLVEILYPEHFYSVDTGCFNNLYANILHATRSNTSDCWRSEILLSLCQEVICLVVPV